MKDEIADGEMPIGPGPDEIGLHLIVPMVLEFRRPGLRAALWRFAGRIARREDWRRRGVERLNGEHLAQRIIADLKDRWFEANPIYARLAHDI